MPSVPDNVYEALIRVYSSAQSFAGHVDEEGDTLLTDKDNDLIDAFLSSDPTKPCDAMLYHGPGHQSRSRCEVAGAHEVHSTHYMGQRAEWRDGSYTNELRAQGIEFNPDSYPENMGMTGYFDEPPEMD